MRKILAILAVLVGFCAFNLYMRHAKPDLTILGFIHMEDGLGRQSAELIDAFRGELKVNLIETRKAKKSKVPKRFHKLLNAKNPKWGKVILFEEMLWWPKQEKYRKILKSDREKSIRIAYSMWESTKIPDEWVLILNEHFDAVAVPSHFLVEAYRSSGVTIPIFELPLGLNLAPFLKEPLKEQKGDPFVFGNLSVCSERKNQVQLIRAFAKAFGNDPHILLRINCRYGEKEISNAITEEIAKLKLDNIIFTQFSLSKEEYLNLFKTMDCYVSPSKGEGFSIQPREAMALGIPVIATDNTGQEAICSSGLVKSLKSPLMETAIFPWGNSYGHNFNCNVDALADALKEVKDNYDVYIGHAAQSRQWAESYQYENLQTLYRSLVKPQKVALSDENKITPECLFIASKELYEKYHRVF
ncbi:MAG: Glycosyltransferase Gtf1 [Chlamydiae bacterium]|nr:Glycosyltransferase Gtf1 [Chlamydiota bacterium]